MSQVLLGLPGQWADNYREISDIYTTKIGGLPDWPVPELVEPALLQCSSCGSKLCLIVQVYAPISSGNTKIEERQIYVFGCLTPNCGTSAKSWKALRVQSSNELKKVHYPSQYATQSNPSSAVAPCKNENWWDNFDEDDDEDIDLEQLSKALSEASSLASHSKKQNSRKHTETVVKPSLQISNDVKTQVLPCFYIYTKEESPIKGFASICTNYSSLSIKENKNSGKDQVEDEAWEPEKYEYDRALSADRTYLKFKKRLDANPEQCFRYSYGGKPLFAAEDRGDIERCSLCSEPRHFEVQLMPPLVYFLQEAADISQKEAIDSWNWMTLIIYTCSKGCFPTPTQNHSINEGWTVAEEAVVVQYEEDSLDVSDRLGFFS